VKEIIVDWIRNFYVHEQNGVIVFDQESYMDQAPAWAFAMFIAMVAFSLVLWWLARQVLIRGLHSLADHTKAQWDDHLLKNRVFRAVAYLLPLAFLEYFFSIVFYEFPALNDFSRKVTDILIIIVVLISINRTLNAIRDILKSNSIYRDKPIQSYFQISKIGVTFIFVILILSRIANQSPWFFLTSLGAMTAILALVFKDTILGFVSSVQLAANDMIRIGDWVTVEKYGVDGFVTEINVGTVMVQNFDMTISTIPTYAFINDSFVNWRGMQNSHGRRIKRSLYIQIDSVRFASDELLKKLGGIRILKDYIDNTQREIEEYNNRHGFGEDDFINARRQTNIGLFRMYIENYLLNHSAINQDMPLMSRQLAPTPNGVPLEIYCFTADKIWVNYEKVMADIFDHLLATVGTFELTLFENPSGKDFRRLTEQL
jgi:miniconductance mechanosensitive channel